MFSFLKKLIFFYLLSYSGGQENFCLGFNDLSQPLRNCYIFDLGQCANPILVWTCEVLDVKPRYPCYRYKCYPGGKYAEDMINPEPESTTTSTTERPDTTSTTDHPDTTSTTERPDHDHDENDENPNYVSLFVVVIILLIVLIAIICYVYVYYQRNNPESRGYTRMEDRPLNRRNNQRFEENEESRRGQQLYQGGNRSSTNSRQAGPSSDRPLAYGGLSNPGEAGPSSDRPMAYGAIGNFRQAGPSSDSPMTNEASSSNPRQASPISGQLPFSKVWGSTKLKFNTYRQNLRKNSLDHLDESYSSGDSGQNNNRENRSAGLAASSSSASSSAAAASSSSASSSQRGKLADIFGPRNDAERAAGMNSTLNLSIFSPIHDVSSGVENQNYENFGSNLENIQEEEDVQEPAIAIVHSPRMETDDVANEFASGDHLGIGELGGQQPTLGQAAVDDQHLGRDGSEEQLPQASFSGYVAPMFQSTPAQGAIPKDRMVTRSQSKKSGQSPAPLYPL